MKRPIERRRLLLALCGVFLWPLWPSLLGLATSHVPVPPTAEERFVWLNGWCAAALGPPVLAVGIVFGLCCRSWFVPKLFVLYYGMFGGACVFFLCAPPLAHFKPFQFWGESLANQVVEGYTFFGWIPLLVGAAIGRGINRWLERHKGKPESSRVPFPTSDSMD